MSTTSASRATPSSSDDNDTTGNARGIKVATPDYFYGDRNKLEEWLLQFDLYFTFQGSKLDDERQVPLMATYMRGPALAWIKPALTKYMADEAPSDVKEWMEDFDEFKKKIRVVFGNKSEVNIATRNIQTLKQTRSVADYANVFQQYSLLVEWDDKALMTMFRQGLKNEVKVELMRSGASLDNLEDLMNEAIDIDTRLYELSLELKPNYRYQQSNHGRSRHNNNNRQYRTDNYANRSAPRVTHLTRDTYGAEPMVLDNLNKGRPNHRTRGSRSGYQGNHSQRDNKRSENDRTCYNCGKPGHIARNCRSKDTNKVVRQVNVLTRETQEEDTEWDIITDDVGQLTVDSDLDDAPRKKPRMERPPTPHHSKTRDQEAPMTPPDSPEQKRISPINVQPAFDQTAIHIKELEQLLEEQRVGTLATDRIKSNILNLKKGIIIYPAGETAATFFEVLDNIYEEEARLCKQSREDHEMTRRKEEIVENNQRAKKFNERQTSNPLHVTLEEERYFQAIMGQPDTEVEDPEDYRTPPEEAPKDGRQDALAKYEEGLKTATRVTIKEFGNDSFLGTRLAPRITPEKSIPLETTNPSSSSQ